MATRFNPSIRHGSATTGTFSIRVAPTHPAATEVRDDVRRYLGSKATERGLANDIELVVAELITNAVEQCPVVPLEVFLALRGASIHLTVTNHRPPGALDLLEPAITDPEPLADRGRGLTIVHALVDGMWFHDHGNLTSVSCLRNRVRRRP